MNTHIYSNRFFTSVSKTDELQPVDAGTRYQQSGLTIKKHNDL